MSYERQEGREEKRGREEKVILVAKVNAKKAGKMKLENVIYYGDNLTWLKK